MMMEGRQDELMSRIGNNNYCFEKRYNMALILTCTTNRAAKASLDGHLRLVVQDKLNKSIY